MFIAIMTVNLIALLLDVKYKHSFVLLGLNIAGDTASTLGIISIIRYGFSGLHGKSYVSLTIDYIMVSSRSNCLLLFYCRKRGTY